MAVTSDEPSAFVAALDEALRSHADKMRAEAMTAYMKHHFAFFGVPATPRRALQRQVFGGWKPTEAQLFEFSRLAWQRDQREMQYAACDLLDRHRAGMSARTVDALRSLIVTKSWWDTVDQLAPLVGGIVKTDPGLTAVMDVWIDDANLWLRRVALLHQLRWKADTDADRLFDYCARRAHESEFFIRKAIGWSLREYAKSNPTAVRAFVESHQTTLSGLSRREALQHAAPQT